MGEVYARRTDTTMRRGATMIEPPSPAIHLPSLHQLANSSIGEVVDVVRDERAVLDRLHWLIRANRGLAEEHDLAAVLRKTVDIARQLVGARYSALCVLEPGGRLTRHLTSGRSPIRLQHGVGVPEGRDAWCSLAGVPIRVHGLVFARLYLTGRIAGLYSPDDDELLDAFAASAGIAIENAMLDGEKSRRQLWADAAAEVTSRLLSRSIGLSESLEVLAGIVKNIAGADMASVLLLRPDGSLAVVGIDAAETVAGLAGLSIPVEGSLAGQVVTTGQAVTVSQAGSLAGSDATAALIRGPAMLVPLTKLGVRFGVMTVSRGAGEAQFTDADVIMARSFAAQVTVALELTRSRGDLEKLSMLEERDRIARDLHDHAIQRIFAAGLTLQSLEPLIADLAVRARLDDQVTALQTVIVQIRGIVAALDSSAATALVPLRSRIVDVIAEQRPDGAPMPMLGFGGVQDLSLPRALADDIVAVVREGLANITRHAQAPSSAITVIANAGWVEIRVDDTGVGPGSTSRRSGIANLERRARAWGGSSALISRSPAGTRLRWTARLPAVETET